MTIVLDCAAWICDPYLQVSVVLSVCVCAQWIHGISCKFFFFVNAEYCASRAWPCVAESAYLHTIGQELHSDIGVLWTGICLDLRLEIVCLVMYYYLLVCNRRPSMLRKRKLYREMLAEQLMLNVCVFDAIVPPHLAAGPQVISKAISVESVVALRDVICRRPVIWDNLHANDYDRQRLFLGPYQVLAAVELVCRQVSIAHACVHLSLRCCVYLRTYRLSTYLLCVQ